MIARLQGHDTSLNASVQVRGNPLPARRALTWQVRDPQKTNLDQQLFLFTLY